MKALDFNYDGLFLSDFGCIICTFDNPGTDDFSVGSDISFNTATVNFGKRNFLTSIQYNDCLTAEFSICKNVENMMDEENRYFTIEQQRELTRWLNRPEFLPLYIVDEGYENIYFEGSFNLSKVEVAGNIIGFNLEFTSNRPFGLNRPYVRKFTVSKAGQRIVIQDMSDEIGYIYADITITCGTAGTLTITNDIDGRVTEVKNCVAGEKITMKDMIIESDNASHQSNIMNDFNFSFLRISNKFGERKNGLTFSMPCIVTLSYSPIRKVGI